MPEQIDLVASLASVLGCDVTDLPDPQPWDELREMRVSQAGDKQALRHQ